MKPFLTDDFLLQTETAKILYQDYARAMPIFDYHCHLPVEEIANNRKFENLTQVWLEGDHYKWRAMRANGVDEKYITGNASDWEKFQVWAATVPKTLRNPLYHWTHLELKRPFGIEGKLLNSETAQTIYEQCTEQLQQDSFHTQGLLQQMNVKVVCTTDDPIDSLEYHRQLAKESNRFTKIFPAFRPDKAMAVEKPETFNDWVNRLEACADMTIPNYSTFLSALQKRHTFFHENHCRLSDHGVEFPYATEYTKAEIQLIFDRVRQGNVLNLHEILQFKSAVLYELALMDAEKGWVQQFHFGVLRNNNTRMFQKLGPDTGFDSMGDFEIARPLAQLLNRLDSTNQLAKTILYNLNPRDNEMVATMIGNFQDGSVRGKMQFGSGWWFNDQKDGMERQLDTLSNMGLLSTFVGMLTDSRSFLSYPRHEYFRRILCNLLGTDVENGELPHDLPLLGQMVQDICYYNAVEYFQLI